MIISVCASYDSGVSMVFGTPGSDAGELNVPGYLHSDDRYLYVCDQRNWRVNVYSKHTFEFVRSFTLTVSPVYVGTFNECVYIASSYSHQVLVYDQATGAAHVKNLDCVQISNEKALHTTPPAMDFKTTSVHAWRPHHDT